MPGPQMSNVHVDAPLTNLAIMYRNPAFVAQEIFQVVHVIKESDVYYKFDKADRRRIDSDRAMGAEAKEITWDVTNETYNATERALKQIVPDRLVNNSDKAIRPKANTMKRVLQAVMLDNEIKAQAIAQNTVNVGSSSVPTIKWDGTSPTIETDVDTAKSAIRKAAGVMPNKILLNVDVQNAIKTDSTVRNLIRYTMPAAKNLLTDGDLPPILWNLKTVIAGSIQDTANEGQTAAVSDIWTDNVLIWHQDPLAGLEALTYATAMRVKQSGKDILVTVWRENNRKGEFIEVSMIQDEKVVASECAYLLTDVLS